MGYSEYYRLWNIPVYDFLHSYVYRELSPVSRNSVVADED